MQQLVDICVPNLQYCDLFIPLFFKHTAISSPMVKHLPVCTILLLTTLFILTQSHSVPLRDFQQRFGRFGLNAEEKFDLINKYLPNQKESAIKKDNINANEDEDSLINYSNDESFGISLMLLSPIISFIISDMEYVV